MSPVSNIKGAKEIVLFVTCLVDLFTGPSRTGDIEQQIVIGAHGPKNRTLSSSMRRGNESRRAKPNR
jgi:hypothetical protein